MSNYTSAYTGAQIDNAVALSAIIGSAAPTASTVGVVGQRYFDTVSELEYKCTAASGGIYTWKLSDTTTTIVNNLIETTAGKALDATQGKILDEAKVPKTRKVNGKELSQDINLSAPDVGAVSATAGAMISNPAPDTAGVRNVIASTTDLTAGTSSLTTGQVYIVYI